MLNQADVAKEQGLRIDAELLSRRLDGVPVVLASAWKGEGILEVRRAIARALDRRVAMKRVACGWSDSSIIRCRAKPDCRRMRHRPLPRSKRGSGRCCAV